VTGFYHLPRQFDPKGTLFYDHDVCYTLIFRDIYIYIYTHTHTLHLSLLH
jgi:hypothetical protein